ncbi:MAG: hypothetical protein KDA37_08405 [Planctomycetales bacterium]|nr:hypothetical protein [Planctomycetales bacterium]
MKRLSSKLACVFLLAVACGLTGCLMEDPKDGWVIQNGNDRVHFGGWGEYGKKFYAEAWNWRTNRWERLRGQFSSYSGATADGLLALTSLEPPFVRSQDGSETLWDWRDRFFVRPEQWTGSSYNWSAAVRATDETGKLVVLRNSSGNYDTSLPYIWIHCRDQNLRYSPRW